LLGIAPESICDITGPSHDVNVARKIMRSHAGACEARTSDVLLHIGESLDSGFASAMRPGMTGRVSAQNTATNSNFI
jgi:hypothetical protein